MPNFSLDVSTVVFLITLVATFVAAYLGRRHAAKTSDGLAGEKLNRWLIGLSAGATANSGFVVTGAVGLGYSLGAQWILLPLAWLLGDIVFWTFFPSRINAFGKRAKATTLSEILSHNLQGPLASVMALLCAALIIICLGGYVSAQWLSGEKFLAGAFGLPSVFALALFAIVIIAYTAIGGFRGSVYADSFQAILRLIGTTIALVAIIMVANAEPAFAARIAEAGASFLDPLGGGTLATGAGFVIGFAAAAFGFGLGQPQIVSRYLAGASPEETRSAWWIYFGFVQYTWIAMTAFGMLLRGVMPNLADPETGLSVFFTAYMPPLVTGIIVADIFATIAATSNSLLVAMAQALAHDLVPRLPGLKGVRAPLWLASLAIGAATMAFALSIHGSVVDLALSSVSLLGAGLAPAVMIKVLGWRHSTVSLLTTVIVGATAAVVWKTLGYGALVNEAAIGIAAGLLTNFLAAGFGRAISNAPATLDR